MPRNQFKPEDMVGKYQDDPSQRWRESVETQLPHVSGFVWAVPYSPPGGLLEGRPQGALRSPCLAQVLGGTGANWSDLPAPGALNWLL